MTFFRGNRVSDVPQASATWGHKESKANYSTLIDGSNFNDCASGFFVDTNIPMTPLTTLWP